MFTTTVVEIHVATATKLAIPMASTASATLYLSISSATQYFIKLKRTLYYLQFIPYDETFKTIKIREIKYT